jgi:hypothetical protein
MEATAIVENLADDNAFFLHTFGSVLRQIAGESSILKSNITDDDILKIRTKLDCTVLHCILCYGNTAKCIHGVQTVQSRIS